MYVQENYKLQNRTEQKMKTIPPAPNIPPLPLPKI